MGRDVPRLIGEGKVRAGGVSNFSRGLLERAERIRHVDSLQTPFSLIRRSGGCGRHSWSAAHGTGVIVYSPMQIRNPHRHLSASSGSSDGGRRLGRSNPEFQEQHLSRNLALRDALRPSPRGTAFDGRCRGGLDTELAGVSGANVGARSPSQVDGCSPPGI